MIRIIENEEYIDTKIRKERTDKIKMINGEIDRQKDKEHRTENRKIIIMKINRI